MCAYPRNPLSNRPLKTKKITFILTYCIQQLKKKQKTTIKVIPLHKIKWNKHCLQNFAKLALFPLLRLHLSPFTQVTSQTENKNKRKTTSKTKKKHENEWPSVRPSHVGQQCWVLHVEVSRQLWIWVRRWFRLKVNFVLCYIHAYIYMYILYIFILTYICTYKISIVSIFDFYFIFSLNFLFALRCF